MMHRTIDEYAVYSRVLFMTQDFSQKVKVLYHESMGCKVESINDHLFFSERAYSSVIIMTYDDTIYHLSSSNLQSDYEYE